MHSVSHLLYKLFLTWAAARRHGSNAPADRPASILVGVTSFLGDLVMAAPMIGTLKSMYPHAQLVVLVRAGHATLAQRIIGVDRVIEHAGDYGWLRRMRRDFPQGFDLGVLAFETKLLPLCAALRIRHVISFVDPKGRHRRCIDTRVMLPTHATHQARLLLHLIGRPNAIVMAPHLRSGDLAPFIHGLSGRIVVIHPGARSPLRRWPLHNYEAVATACLERGASVVLNGWERDAPGINTLAQALIERWGTRRVLCVPEATSLEQTMALLRDAELIIGPDTGILHLAKALGSRTIILMGQSQLALFGPDAGLYLNTEYLHVDGLECRDKKTVHGLHAAWIAGCSRTTCALASSRCLLDIESAHVVSRFPEWLADHGS